MRVVGIAVYAEPILHKTFGTVGVWASRRPRVIVAAVVACLIGLSVGNWYMETEHHVSDLMIARRGRIAGEKNFFEDNFDLISPVLNSVVVTPKEGVDILSVEALDEVRALQESIRTFSFEYRPGLNVSLEQICFKMINADPTEPCWQSSLLESFREGDVFNVGGELNSNYDLLYADRPSYRDFDFRNGFTRSFIAQTNLNPDSVLLGSFEVGEDGDTITSVGALQIGFGAKSPDGLRNDGLQYFEWTEREAGPDPSAAFCPDETQCDVCAPTVQPVVLASAGCSFDGASAQPDSCCAVVGVMRSSPCIETILQRRPELGAVGNALFAACGVEAVDITPRCNNLPLILGEEAAALLSQQTQNPVQDAAAESPAASQETEEASLDVQVQYDATVSVVSEETETTGGAMRVTHAWEKAWREQIGDVVRNYQYIDVVWLTSTSASDEISEAGNAEVGLFVLGYCLVLAYILFFVTFDWKLTGVHLARTPPGPFISALCYCAILLSVAAAMGVAGYVSQLTSIKVSITAIQMIPMLMVGLGVNDFFILCSTLKTVITSPTCPNTSEEIMYEMMAFGGTSITLSSVANTAAFSLGALTSVPIVLWFSVQMAFGIVIAYIVSVTAIPSLLSLSVKRHLEGKTDILMSMMGVKAETAASEVINGHEGQGEGKFAGWVRRMQWPITVSVFSVFAVWMVMGMLHLVHMEQGASLRETVQEDSHTYDFLTETDRHFDTSQIDIVFEDTVNYANPDDFQSARQSEFEYIDEGDRTERRPMATSWMEFYTQYVETLICANEICLNEVNWYYDGFSSPEFAHPSRNICNGVETPEECQTMCATHCPQGPEGSDFRCQYQEESNSCYCPYRPMLVSELFYENPEDFDSSIGSYWSDFLVYTPAGRSSRIFINFDEETQSPRNQLGMPEASRSYVYARGLQSVSHQIDHITRGRDILDRQDIDVYAFDYVIYGIGEQFEDLAVETVEAIGISMAVATIVMLPLILNVFTAIIVSGCVLLSVLLTAGSTSWTELNMDYAAYLSFVVAVGLSVEFCAHIARDFMLATGDRITRSIHALQTIGIAVLNGGITTFLSILPSAFSQFPIIHDRLFVQFSIIVLAGLFTGLLFLPVVLSLIGPPSFNEQKFEVKSSVKREKNLLP